MPRSFLRRRNILLIVLLGGSSPADAQTLPDCTTPSYDCAVAQVQRQDFAAAIPSLERIVQQSPRDLKAINLLGIALTGAGRIDDANARFRAALAIDARFTPALKNLAINDFTSGRLRAARQHFETVLEQTPNDDIAHVHLAEIDVAEKNCRGALPHYEKSRTRVARTARWTLNYAGCLFDQGNRKEGLDVIAALKADDPSIAFDAGVLLGRYAAHAEAARFFGAARRGGYKDAYAAGYNETLMLIESGRHDAAIQVATELIGQGVKPAELYNLVSRAYAGAGRIKDAYDTLREATRLEPTVAEHYIDLAMLCLEHENYDLGLEIVDIGLKHRPDSPMLYLQRGVVLAMKGSVELAEQEFDRASRAAPGDPAAPVALAMVWMQRGQTPKAIELLRARARKPPHAAAPQPTILYALGIALLRSGAAPDDPAATEALGAFRTAVHLRPTFVQAQAELGKLLLKRGDVDAAIAHLEQAIALEPDNAAPAYVLAQAYRRAGKLDRAQALLARVSRLNAQERGDDPDTDLRRMMFRIVREGTRPDAISRTHDPAAAIGEAIACAVAGDLDGAAAKLRAALETSPSAAAANYQLAVVLWNRYQQAGGARQKRDLDEATASASKAVTADPNNPQLQLVFGQLLAEQQDLQRAIDHLRHAVSLAPDNPDPLYNLGLALRLRGDLDGAEAQFRATLAKRTSHTLARRSLGLVLRQKGDLAGALAELRRAVAETPDDPQAQHLLGTVLLKEDDLAAAVAAFREAVRLDPTLTEARVLLAQALARQGHADDARREQAEVLRINAATADRARARVLLDSSAALAQKGDLAGAIAQRREAAALAPRLADAHYELGVALAMQSGAQKEAEAALRQTLAIDPTHGRAHAALGQLLRAAGNDTQARAAFVRASALMPCSYMQP